MGHMLGVEDQFNMCLFTIETVEHICMIMLRYIFLPLIQLETPKFKEMMNALLKGLSPFLPHMTYDFQMFNVKRVIGVPGYQYNVDLSKEKISRQLFSMNEMNEVKKIVTALHAENNVLLKIDSIIFNDGIPILEPNNTIRIKLPSEEKVDNETFNDDSMEVGDKRCSWIMRSKDDGDWKTYLNDSKFHTLSKTDKFLIRWRCFLLQCYENVVGRYFCEMSLSAILYIMRRYYEAKIVRKNS